MLKNLNRNHHHCPQLSAYNDELELLQQVTDSTLCEENESYQEIQSPIFAHRGHHHHNAISGSQKNEHLDNKIIHDNDATRAGDSDQITGLLGSHRIEAHPRKSIKNGCCLKDMNLLQCKKSKSTNHQKENGNCEYCDQHIPKNKNIYSHLTKECECPQMQCDHCLTVCYINHYKQHIINDCKKVPIPCHLCKTKVPKHQLEDHEQCQCTKTHCEFCKKIVDKDKIEVHQQRMCQEALKTCDKCNSTFKRKDLFKHQCSATEIKNS